MTTFKPLGVTLDEAKARAMSESRKARDRRWVVECFDGSWVVQDRIPLISCGAILRYDNGELQ